MLAGRLLAGSLLAAALVLSSCTSAPDPGSDAGSGSSAPDAGTSAPAGEDAPGSTPDGAAPGTDTEPGSGGNDAEPGSGGNDAEPEADGTASAGRSGGQSGGEGSEVAPSAPDRSGGDSLGESVPAAAGRLSTEQRTGTAAGLVEGFPDDVVLVPEGAEVESSSVTGADGRYQVTIDATVDDACDAVVLDYRAWFTTGGFAETDTTARPGRTTVGLARDDGTVQLGAARTDAGCDVTILAALSAE